MRSGSTAGWTASSRRSSYKTEKTRCLFCRQKKVAEHYDQAFASSPPQTPKRVGWSDHVFHQYTLIAEGISRDRLVDELRNAACLHDLLSSPASSAESLSGDRLDGQLKVTKTLSKGILLADHTEMDQEQLNFISQPHLRSLIS